MDFDNNIKNFTAADIEKYHKGLLSNKEMHDLEKAAMDDPFLADALEGYAVAGVNATTDIADLKKRLAGKTEGAKVIPLNAPARNNFKSLRAAIVIAFIAGAGLLIYQFGFNKKSGEIAQTETSKKENNSKTGDPVTNDSASSSTNNTPPESATKTGDAKSGPVSNDHTFTVTDKETKPGSVAKEGSGEANVVTGKSTFDDVVATKPTPIQTETKTPVLSADERVDGYKKTDKFEEKKDIAREEADKKNKLNENKQDVDNNLDKSLSNQQNNRSVAATRKANEQNFGRDQATNIFRGQVTDANNVGLPFANVTNLTDNNAGTYTDARGNFTLTYPDSVLTVQIRSIGFENNNVQLRNAVPNNQVVLQEDRRGLAEVVVSQQKPDAALRSRDGTMKLDEPEPADGWNNYGTYLTNNLSLPSDLKSRQSGNNEVQISFEVNKKGEPTNIKVEKSLCTECDKEAIRLVKEGPKWKNKSKKARTTVSINF